MNNTKAHLIELCKQHKIKGYGNKTKEQLFDMLNVDAPNDITAIDLFCGCGGMSKGLEEAGIKIVGAMDIWKQAVDNYNKNFTHQAMCEDIRNISPEDFKRHMKINQEIDLLVGGPPCQGFSIAGKRDPKDPRNSLFMDYVRYLDYFNPKAFIMENVMGLLSMKNQAGEKVIDIITEFLSRNYNIIISKLYASDFEVPQNRRRVIIIGIRKDIGITPYEPEKIIGVDVSVGSVLLKRDEVDKSHFLSERAIDGIIAKKERSKSRNAGFGAQYLNLEKPSYTIPARYWKDGYDALVKYADRDIRRLTIQELKRIQSFSDDYILEGSKKDVIMQIGNAVAVKFAYHLGKHIIKLIKPT